MIITSYIRAMHPLVGEYTETSTDVLAKPQANRERERSLARDAIAHDG